MVHCGHLSSQLSRQSVIEYVYVDYLYRLSLARRLLSQPVLGRDVIAEVGCLSSLVVAVRACVIATALAY